MEKMEKKALPLQWLGYEFRRLGRVGSALPMLSALPFAGLAALMHLLGAGEWQVERMLAAYLELGLPLAAGLVASQVIADDPAVDLQLSLRTRYRTTVLRRLALTVGWAVLFAAVWASALWAAGLLWEQFPEPLLLGVLSWLAPLLFFVGAGALLALIFRSYAASVAILVGVWIFELALPSLFLAREWLRPLYLFATVRTPLAEADFWLSNRIALIGVALVLVLGVALILGNSESLATGGEE